MDTQRFRVMNLTRRRWWSALPAALLIGSTVLMSGCVAFVAGGAVATGLAVHDRRSFGTVVDDNVLEFRISDAMYTGDRFGTADRIKITAYNGWVLLAGEVRTEDRVIEAEERAASVAGVRRVVNELAPLEKAGAGQRSQDTWLSTRAKTSLANIRDLPGFNPTRVKVTAVRNEVFLMGLVTREEAEAAAEAVRRVGGVERVVTIFEYLEDGETVQRG